MTCTGSNVPGGSVTVTVMTAVRVTAVWPVIPSGVTENVSGVVPVGGVTLSQSLDRSTCHVSVFAVPTFCGWRLWKPGMSVSDSGK